MTADPPTALWDTLENLLAPGRRVRLSPFVETAQCEVLLGARPDDQHRAESLRAIVQAEGHAATIRRIAGHWAAFAAGGKDFAGNDYAARDFLDAYLAYYFSVNVPKIQLVLLGLARDGLLSGDLTLLDVGVGTGTTAIAVLDFLLAWGHTCDLHRQPFPVTGLRLTGLDRSTGSLGHAQEIVLAYARALHERLQSRPAGDTRASQGGDILQRVHDWAIAATWRYHDLEDGIPALDERPNMIVAANVWNELRGAGRTHLDALLAQLPAGGLAIMVEPGEKRRAGELMSWRREFLARHQGVVALAPCGQEFGGTLPGNCAHCWNMRREAFHQPSLYREFRGACAELRSGRGHFDDFENRLLSWSYVVIGRHPGDVTTTPPPTYHLQPDTLVEQPLDLRYIGSYHSRDGQVTPVGYGPDTFHDATENGAGTRVESLKVCPAGQTAAKVVLRRDSGFQVPPLRYGERFALANVRVRERDDAYILVRQPDDHTVIERTIASGHAEFLPEYDPAVHCTVRTAIDEIGYRLFGFPALRPFQHTILARVLTGRSILGIAATGGGKSECFILPAMLLPGVTVVVSPLKALMTDQYDQRICARYGLDHLATFINSDVPFVEREARLRRLELGHYKLVYFTPEQLERGYVLESLRRADAQVGLRYLALDEAHCISQWGHDFRPSYLNIIHRFREYALRPVRIALTATASPDVRADICEELHLNPASVQDGGDLFIESSNRPELNLIVRVRPSTGAKVDGIIHDLRDLLRHNKSNEQPGAAIVFMPHQGGAPDDVNDTARESRMGHHSAGVTRFASYLERQLGEQVAIYHGGMDTDAAEPEAAGVGDHLPGDMRGRRRQSEQRAFIGGERPIMVATNGFGMGIDKPNIRLIVHRTPPANLEAYAQEAGRAGRDGEQADVILYYSPDSPQEVDDLGKARSVQSDHEIQSYFLSNRYVRRRDVLAMRAFLRKLDRRIGDTLYFTNDEAIAFFDKYSDSGSPYEWPEFPPRQQTGYEYGEHKAIRNRGHSYEQKTKYIDRILQALYRIRPTIDGVKDRIVFLDLVQETRAEIRCVNRIEAQAILGSNAYFGRVLRDRKIDAEEFSELVRSGDVLQLARRLALTVHETAALLGDIKSSDRQSSLIDYASMDAPRYGPAAGKTSLDAWRKYAGAARRATALAYERAQRAGRTSPTLDDWFGWTELPRRRGWEVRPGSALLDDAHFGLYLDAFMALHDLREANDWAAYRRLLTDYVGVEEGGTLAADGRGGGCLRAVLLGYLKTSETIRDGNCRSCNRCVPDERFDRYSLEERRAVIVRIGHRLEGLLGRAETHAGTLPPAALIEEIFAALREEEAHGNAVVRYVEGWTARLLDQQAEHRAALWVRLRAMRDGLVAPQPRAFAEDARRLVGAAAKRDDPRPLWDLLARVNEDDSLCAEPAIHEAQAELARRLNLVSEEQQALKRIVAFFGIHRAVDPIVTRRAYMRLRELHAADGPLSSPELWRDSQLWLARFATDARSAEREYALLVTDWSWEQTLMELEYGNNSLDARTSTRIGLLCAWIMASRESAPHRIVRVADYLTAAGWLVVEQATEPDLRVLVDCCDAQPFMDRPSLAGHFAEIILATRTPDDWQVQEGLPLCLAALAGGETVAPHAVAAVNDAILRSSKYAAVVQKLLRPYATDPVRMGLILHAITAVGLPSGKHLSQWLAVFPIDALLAAPPDVALAALHATKADHITEATLDAFWPLVKALTLDTRRGLEAHRHWLTLCRHRPLRLANYVRELLETLPGRTDWVEEAFELLLDIGDSKSIHYLLGRLSEWTGSCGVPRLDHATAFYTVMKASVAPQTGPLGTAVRREDLLVIRHAFAPWSSVPKADMLVIIIRTLRERLNPNWLTPIEFEAEALCDARRVDEALTLNQLHPGLKVGPQRDLLSTRIELLRRTRVVRNGDTYGTMCRRILHVCFLARSR